MHPTHAILQKFYQAFQVRDGETMASLYDASATFSDPIFPSLCAEEVGDMWRMLTSRGRDLELSFEILEANDSKGCVRWKARYTFSQTGLTVNNTVEASFSLRDGKIIQHTDDFSLWKWSRMALGLRGWLFGWLPPVQAKIRRQALDGLQKYRATASPSRRPL